jgi:ABC-type spermidine/putrescine transport system permease subunit II
MLARRGTLPFLVGPPLLWLALFFLLPLLLIAAYSIRAGSGAVGPSDPWALSAEHYQEVFGTPAFLRLLGVSVLTAVGVAGRRVVNVRRVSA